MRKTTLVLLLAAVLAPALFLTTCTMVPGSYYSFDYPLEGTWETVNTIRPYYTKGKLIIDGDKIMISGGFTEDSNYSAPFHTFPKDPMELEGYSRKRNKDDDYTDYEGDMFIEDKGELYEIRFWYQRASTDKNDPLEDYLRVKKSENSDDELHFRKVKKIEDK